MYRVHSIEFICPSCNAHLTLQHLGMDEDCYSAKCNCGLIWAVEEYSDYVIGDKNDSFKK